MNRNLMVALAALTSAVMVGKAQAAVVTTVNPTATKTIVISSTLAPDTVGQTFVPTEDRLTGLGFRFGSSTTSTTGTVTLSIYEGAIAAGTSLPASALYTSQSTLTGLGFRSLGNYFDLFSGNIAVNANASYTAVLTATSNVLLGFGSSDGYAPGYLLQTTVNDATCRSTPTACDASFRFTTATALAPVPETATWIMMMGGLALAGGALRYRRRHAAGYYRASAQ